MLRTIEKNAFYLTSIQSIKIPSKLVELKDGWCNVTAILTQIYVSPDNPRYFNYDDKFILGKSSIEQDFYDQLVFSARNIETANIPSFIE